jgi:hypothetical protein
MATPLGSKTLEVKLATLKDLYGKNLLTEEQYDEQVKAALNAKWVLISKFPCFVWTSHWLPRYE